MYLINPSVSLRVKKANANALMCVQRSGQGMGGVGKKMEGEQQPWAVLRELLVCFRGIMPRTANLENIIPNFQGLQSVLCSFPCRFWFIIITTGLFCYLTKLLSPAFFFIFIL